MVLVAFAVVAAGIPAPADAATPVRIVAVSTRADLVSGGDVLLEVDAPSGVSVTVGRRDVSRSFKQIAPGRHLGLVSGLPRGTSTVQAVVGGRGARLTVHNHPLGGPVFSGPQVEPWLCETEAAGLGPALDSDCNAPRKIDYLYLPPGGNSLQPYDPENPPPAVAETTTDDGKTVPFIVRRETGTVNRSVYVIGVLADPKAPADPTRASAFNGALYYRFGGGAAPNYRQGSAPENPLRIPLLGRGFATANSTLNIFGQNTNTVTSAETAIMVKERVAEILGPIRYTVASGGSGGSIQLHIIANAYPGLVDGFVTAISFPDLASTAQEVGDCALLNRYYDTAVPPVTPLERQAVNGHESASSCLAWDRVFNLDANGFDPRIGCIGGANPAGNVPEADYVYDPQTNPTGARCTFQDQAVNTFGRRPRSAWGPVERKIGRGFGNRPYDNRGVQYGLRALRAGTLSIAQFLELNQHVGGFDIDGVWQPTRSAADPDAVTASYRTSQLNDARQLDQVPIIDGRPHLNEEIHTQFHSLSMRARLDAAHGTHANQAVWVFDPATQEDPYTDSALDVLIDWVKAVVADRSPASKAQKVRRHKPAAAADACFVQSVRIEDPQQCAQLYPSYANPRIAAGGRLADDVLTCVRVAPKRAGYPTMTDAQWAQLRSIFPAGVCDEDYRAVAHSHSATWLAFDRAGGRPLGPAPTSVPFVVSSGPGATPAGGTLPTTGGGTPAAAAALLFLLLAGALRRRRGASRPS
jgi:hypothetical protein